MRHSMNQFRVLHMQDGFWTILFASVPTRYQHAAVIVQIPAVCITHYKIDGMHQCGTQLDL